MSTTKPATAAGRFINAIEETLIAIILGAMTIITFANVVARYIFDSNILWALETTVFLFAWLVLLGVSYCVKVNAHLGVDAVVRLFPRHTQRTLTMIAVACCLAFAALLLVGSWNYWAPFAGLPPLWDLWNQLGLGEIEGSWRDQGWYEVQDIPMPDFLRFMEDWINQGEEYEKMPRAIPYFVLPFGMLLLMLRFIEAGWKVATGRTELIIAAHEAEEAAAEVAERAEKGV